MRGTALLLALSGLIAASPDRADQADRSASAPACDWGPGRILCFEGQLAQSLDAKATIGVG